MTSALLENIALIFMPHRILLLISGELFIVLLFVSVLVSQPSRYSVPVFADTELPTCLQPAHILVSLLAVN